MTPTTPPFPETPRPKVSVCVVTYNQEKYIAQCLQSLVDQETDFPFEVIVSDDCSTDGTSDIVRSFVDKYPNTVRHIFHEKNIGAYKNYKFIHAYAKSRCDYIAHVDGDDCALPGKLAAQVAVLDGCPEVALSAHAVEVIDQNRVIGDSVRLPEWGDINALLRLGTYFVNSSTMYRASNAFDHDDQIDVIDYYSHIEQASRGGIHLNKKCFGAYRWHPDGISKSEAHRERIEHAYAVAFDRALQLGAPPREVRIGRLIRQKSFALNRFISGDKLGFVKLIHLDFDGFLIASVGHRALYIFQRFFLTGFGERVLLARINKLKS